MTVGHSLQNDSNSHFKHSSPSKSSLRQPIEPIFTHLLKNTNDFYAPVPPSLLTLLPCILPFLGLFSQGMPMFKFCPPLLHRPLNQTADLTKDSPTRTNRIENESSFARLQ
ncbi:MAG: hypothetical protein D4R77_08755 [Planctomycetaceae bacterium]|jgi:hypothetical protein|nr:MAG: hypothetical protein D4R77_08755 [Planctomycetaceae bacterium]